MGEIFVRDFWTSHKKVCGWPEHFFKLCFSQDFIKEGQNVKKLDFVNYWHKKIFFVYYGMQEWYKQLAEYLFKCYISNAF